MRKSEDIKRLITLPCDIGGDIFWVDADTKTVRCEEKGIRGILVRKDKFLIEDKTGTVDEIGTTYCHLTRESAEKELVGFLQKQQEEFEGSGI